MVSATDQFDIGIREKFPGLFVPVPQAIQRHQTSKVIRFVAIFLDQTLIRSVDVSRFDLTSGKVGITASSFENSPVLAAFDWVRVSEP